MHERKHRKIEEDPLGALLKVLAEELDDGHSRIVLLIEGTVFAEHNEDGIGVVRGPEEAVENLLPKK